LDTVADYFPALAARSFAGIFVPQFLALQKTSIENFEKSFLPSPNFSELLQQFAQVFMHGPNIIKIPEFQRSAT
jgi:hypothetical protein